MTELLHPEDWRFDRNRQARIQPDKHEGLAAACAQLWASEVGTNLNLIAWQQGIGPALQTAISATVAYVISNVPEAFDHFAVPFAVQDLDALDELLGEANREQ